MRLALLLSALLAAFGLSVLTSQTPAPVAATAPADTFSAERAMVDIRHIAQDPRPLGSEAHARTRDYLLERMTALGLEPAVQTGNLSPQAVRRIENRDINSVGLMVQNVVGVLRGTDPSLPAVAIMAHYDSVPLSPGAADAASAVAASLEIVKAIKARGPAPRDLVVLMTDAEELNLDGARAFFSEHPWRDRIGAVVNMEARGGGGLAAMFETGQGNAETIALFTDAARKATGGPSSSSLSVFVYGLMSNGTDFTIPARRGIAGVNLAYIGRPDQYHAPSSTPDALDQGSVQHLGSQALEATDAFLRAEALPRPSYDAVYSDVFGLFTLRHHPATGWWLLGLATALTGFAAWGAHHVNGLKPASVLKGASGALWLLATVFVLAQATRVIGGPVGEAARNVETYYLMLRRLPWLEIGASLSTLAGALILLGGRATFGRRLLAGGIVAVAVLTLIVGGLNIPLVVAALMGAALTLWPKGEDETPWAGWLGVIAVVLALSLVAQMLAPQAAFILIWPALVASIAAAATAVIGARLERWQSLLPPVIATALVGAWLLNYGHGVFLGIGMDLPGALGVIALLVLMLVRPVVPPELKTRRALCAAGVLCLVLGCAFAAGGHLAEPVTTTLTVSS